MTHEQVAKMALELEWKDVETQARLACDYAARTITALLEVMKWMREREYNGFEPDNQSATYRRLDALIRKVEEAA